MTFTKIMGSLCGSLLVFLLGKWVAEEIYHVGGGHGDGHGAAYVIDTGGDEAEEVEEVEEVVTLAALYPTADAAAGERVFNKCKACHAAEDGNNGVGPHLYGVVGRDIGVVDGYNYSGALSEAADVWTADNLYAFLEDPAGWAPGTSMGYAGLKKPEDRANVIAYLDMTDGDMTEVAAEQAAAEDAPAAAEEVETAAAETDSNAVEAEEAATEEVEPTAEAAAEAAEETAEATEEAAVEETAAEAPAAEDAAASTGGDMSAFATMVAAADVAAGEKAFRKCAACHKANEEKNGVGPHMIGVVGRDVASVDGFKYSDALAGLDGAWTVDELSAWLENPKDYAPGNKMAYRGVKKEEERANLIAYLATLGQ